jgi:hypothetical protein
MIENPKSIWRLANVLGQKSTFQRTDGNEWVRVNPGADTRDRFQAWLDSRPVAPETAIFVVRDVRDVVDAHWSTVLSEWPNLLIEGRALRIIAQDNSWILVFNEIGVAKFGTMGSTNRLAGD